MEKTILRHVDIDGYQLKTWSVGQRPDGKEGLGYEFITPEGKTLFTGEDFGCSPMNAIDSNATLRSLLTFLTLSPGDTESDYFADYTPEQMEFAEGDAESLVLWTLDPEERQPSYYPYYPVLKIKRSDEKMLNEYQTPRYDPLTGLVWIEDGTAGVAHSAHPNVEANRITRKKHPTHIEVRGFLYSPEVFASTELDKLAAKYCRCIGCYPPQR